MKISDPIFAHQIFQLPPDRGQLQLGKVIATFEVGELQILGILQLHLAFKQPQ